MTIAVHNEGTMKLLVLAVVASCATSAPHLPAASAPGVLAQVEASRDLDGAVVGDRHARPTILVVFASWCEHCKDELRVLDAVRGTHAVRMIGINYTGHEEYDHRGSSHAVRAFARGVPWLRVVPVDD